ncbi:MAG: PAS domain S-box protein [Anaerolineales bacterium]
MREAEKSQDGPAPGVEQACDRQMELLYRAGRALTSVLDLDQVLKTLLSEIRKLLGAVASSVWLVEPLTGRLVCRQSSGPRSERVAGWALEPGEGVVGWVIQQGESLNVADVTAESRYHTEVAQAAKMEIRSLLTVPLRLREQTIGALQLVDEVPGRFGEAELSLLESLAAFAAIGIENARLYEQAQREIEKRRKMEAALQESERRYRALLENVNDVLYDVNADGQITYISGQAEQYGIEPEALIGTSMDEAFRHYIHPEDQAYMEKAFAERAERGQTTYQFRVSMPGHADALWFEDTGRVYKDAAGEIAGVIGMLRDVTERREAEEALRRSEEQLRRLVESAEDIICVHDAGGRYLYYSGPSRYGATGESLVGKSPYDLFPMERAQPIVEQIQTVFASGESLVSENRVEWQGESLWFLDQLYPIEDERGRVIAVGKICHNITTRKRMEAAVRESELKYRTLVESALHGIVIFQEGRIVYANETAARYIGYTVKELLALSPDEIALLFPPERRERYMEILRKGLAGENLPLYREYRIERSDGSIRWMDGTLGRIEYRGRPALQIIFSDVTARKAMEAALRESEDRFRILANTAPVLIWMADAAGACTYFNRPWLDFRGRTLEEELGDGWVEGVHPEDRDDILEIYRAAVEAQRNYTLEYRLRRADGEYRWLLDVGTPRYSPDGTLVGFIGSCTDITEQKRAEQAERRQAAQLRALATRLTQVEEANHQRLARELHDRVGQSLTAIGINLNIIGSLLPEESPFSLRERLDDSRSLVEEVTESTRAMMSDLRPPVLDDYGLPATLHWYAEHFEARTGIAIEMELQEIEPRLPLEREVALFRVVQEALTNVAKHAHASEVRITLEVEEERIRLEVADDGAGFAGAVPREPEGSEGWGLLTMKERAAALGGELRIEAQPGEGTRVAVEAPR